MNIEFTNAIDSQVNENIIPTGTIVHEYKDFLYLDSIILKGSMILSLAARPISVDSVESNINSSIEFTEMASYNQEPIKVTKRIRSRHRERKYFSEQEWAEYFKEIPDMPESEMSLGSEEDFIKANRSKFPLL